MLQKTITYIDYNGTERKEDFYFNLTKAEITMMDMSEAGGLEAKLQKIIQSLDGKGIMDTFRDIILRSYGEKSPDGKRFIKSEELSREFEQTEAFSQLFMEICTDADAAGAFVRGIVPSDLSSEIDKELAKQKKAGIKSLPPDSDK